MKRIIGEETDDTEAAYCAGLALYGFRGDFWSYEDRLYQKTNGEFFLEKEDFYGNDVRIFPLSEAEAKDWGKLHMSEDEYEETFGKVKK